MAQNTNRCGAYIDGRRTATFGVLGDTKEIRDVRIQHMHDTAKDMWIKWWWSWGGRSVTDWLCHERDTDSPFVRVFEEAGYEQRTGDNLNHL